MSFNLNESQTYINIKLTDLGRRQLSLGKLKFTKAVVSDREIDYSIDRTETFDITTSRILSPADAQPSIDPFNLDGSPAFPLTNQNITALKVFSTASTSSVSFFSATTNSWWLNTSLRKSTANLAYTSQSWDTNVLTYPSTPALSVGDLIWIPWIAPQYGTASIPATSPTLPSNTPFISQFYRVKLISSNSVTVDRSIPRYGSVSHSIAASAYPYSGISTYYGSAFTQNTIVWNLNIARTHDIAGTDATQNGISGFSRYGSIQYAGTRQYFGFSSDTPTVGFIHFTNEMSGKTYGEQFIEGTVKVSAPMILWHHQPGVANSSGSTNGVVLYDRHGSTTFDPVAKTTYRYLKDNISGGTIVGKVYHKLKIIVITDQELLNALSYKSNRNYTYPKPKVSLTPNPKLPLTYNQTTGLCRSDYTYFVTYLPESSSYSSSVSYGHPNAIHCGYIQKIDGRNDINGRPQYLKLEFPPQGFPYMKDDTGLSSGLGWNANSVQLLISEQPKNKNYSIGDVPPTSWRRISTIAAGGNGVYTNQSGGNTIPPDDLNAYSFIISQQDYDSGTTYSLNTAMTSNQEILNFGDESFFFGIVEADVLKAVYKSSITLIADDTQLTASNNPTFDQYLDDDIFISEVSILDNQNNVVAIGKPTYPIRKIPGGLFVFQLVMDF